MGLLTSAARPGLLPEAFVPPLENGDRLTRAEFERRYDAMPGHVRAELVEGVVSMAPPVRHSTHGAQHADLITWAGTYRVGTPGVLGGADATVRLDLDNEPQPEVYLLVDPARGGEAGIDGDGYINGAPEFVAEVAANTASHDLGPKLNAYRRNGVREYLVWRVQDAAIDWFVLRDGRFDRLLPDADGVTRSVVFPGLWLDAAALLSSDLARVHAVLRDGLADPAHAAFVTDLPAARAPR
ncbi:MAG TPA: Uma2 family endonuclease [Urbifossiella sp.]|jgi:Uma2 family endonuclease|nr:Uma2 family endonuclease [Urbifossiella sp.]